MKLSEYKKDFYDFTQKASEVGRNAAFAGIALVWVFKFEQNGVPKLPRDLLLPIGLFALSIGFDLLHYVLGSLVWGIFHRNHEKKLSNPAVDDPDLVHSPLLPFIINTFFTLKIICVIVGYVFVACYVFSEL